MPNTWFTSDTHFGHANIIKYCKRPFSSVEEMDKTLIANWNNVVAPGDTVYHLGDFAVGGGEAGDYILALNGIIKFVRGNHDHRIDRLNKSLNDMHEGGLDIEDLREVNVNRQKIVLCHYAMRIWNKSHHGTWHLYGHSHGTLPDDPNSLSFDIGMDCWNYTPVSFEQVAARIAQKKFKPVDHHNPTTT